MKAIDGRLRVDQTYTLEHTFIGAMHCSNCGNRLHNVAVVKGSLDRISYCIGLDCASTLVGITPDEVKQAKKLFELRRKINRRIKDGFYRKAFVIDNQQVWLYTFDAKTHYTNSRNWYSRAVYENVKDSLSKGKIEVIHLTASELIEMPEGE